MKKPWSISTTVRNPDRIRDFLKIVKLLAGQEWNRATQEKFQVLLIQHKLYGYGNAQFNNGLSPQHLALMENPNIISYANAKAILDSKNYTGGGDMRGRQSFSPIKKMGLVKLDATNKIRITTFGEYFLKEDYDLGDVFLKSLIKWQLPAPDSNEFREADGFCIKPFIATLHLINKVNHKWSRLGNEPVGISKKEFSIFIPTLIDYTRIESTANEIIEFRKQKERSRHKDAFVKRYHYEYVKRFSDSRNSNLIKSIVKNTSEYTDNTIRYFRLTRFIFIRGNGFYIDLEPRRQIEIKRLLETDNAQPKLFTSIEQFNDYVGDVAQPELPWENIRYLKEIVSLIKTEVEELETQLNFRQFRYKNVTSMNLSQLTGYILKLREYRRRIQEEQIHRQSQNVVDIQDCITKLKAIHTLDNRALLLEKYITIGLNALNDALRIKPNYIVGDDNEPTNTATGGMADIECYYSSYNAIYEVTMLNGRDQWYNEGQPVMGHLRDFESVNNDKTTYCVFVAPSIHRNTLNTFWNSVKYEYEGATQKIIPLSIKQFIGLLELLVKLKATHKSLTHTQLLELYESITNLQGIVSSTTWLDVIPDRLSIWGERCLNE